MQGIRYGQRMNNLNVDIRRLNYYWNIYQLWSDFQLFISWSLIQLWNVAANEVIVNCWFDSSPIPRLVLMIDELISITEFTDFYDVLIE